MGSDTDNDAASPSHSAEDSGDQEMEEKNGVQSKDGTQQKKAPSNSKDPSRPRRKKARRACHACQRAHLTCGDERPCQRCIKRGLQDACADGVRKKAKYLHDAPNEALLPGAAASHYQYINNIQRAKQNPQSPTFPITPSNDMYHQRQAGATFPVYGISPSTGQLPVSNGLIDPTGFPPQQSPISGQFQGDARQPPTSLQSLVQAMEQPTTAPDPTTMPEFTGALFDPNDLSQYSFDPASFNFGNHYGALEFGMLGHIASGAAETPPSDTASQLNQTNSTSTFATPGGISTTYNESPVTTQPFMYNQDQGGIAEWRTPSQQQSSVRQSGVFTRGQDPSNIVAKQEIPYAFSIGAGSAFASPTSEMSPPMKNILDESPSTKSFFHGSAPNSRPGTARAAPMHQAPIQQQLPTQESAFPTSSAYPPGRRRGDPSTIYDSVTQPYPYTAGFHSLIAFLQKRFSSQKTLQIAKALASIRPSFISCTKTLGREDLVFMEKCFQRTLWEYEEFINACGTPTLVCRRTGEVAAVGKEFSLLTGWGKDVLLGKEANLNVNTGGSSGPPGTGASSRGGANTPRLPEGTVTSSRPQPVFLAELLDDDSVIQFYEDFAQIAFGDSRASVTTRCKLLQYRTREDESLSLETGEDGRPTKRQRTQLLGRRGTSGAVVEELGDKEGKVECTCCWTVKRDLFDLPMMIVMNFLPCI